MTEDVDAPVVDAPVVDAPGAAPAPARTAEPAGHLRGRRWLRRTDAVVGVCALLYLVCMGLPWFRFEARQLGGAARSPASTVDGFNSAMLTCAAAVLVLAAVWSAVSGWTGRLPFPPVLVTTCLAALCLLLTLPEWLTTFDLGFSPAGLGTVLCATAALVETARASLAELRPAGDRIPGPPDPSSPPV